MKVMKLMSEKQKCTQQVTGADRFQRAGCVSHQLGWFDAMLFPDTVGIACASAGCCQTETTAIHPQHNYHLQQGQQLLNEEEWDSLSRKTPRSLCLSVNPLNLFIRRAKNSDKPQPTLCIMKYFFLNTPFDVKLQHRQNPEKSGGVSCSSYSISSGFGHAAQLCYMGGFNVLFEYFVSLSLDTKINNIGSIALATYRPLLYGWLLKICSNVVRGENTKLKICI